MNPYQVLVRPVVSEKATDLRETQQKYTFWVNKQATKDDVKKAVEKSFEVNVSGIQTSILRGKVKRRGRNLGRTATRKRAIVTLVKGQSLKLFEDQ